MHHRISTGSLVPLSKGVLRVAGVPVSDGMLAMAGVLDSPASAYLSHQSAAAWWGLPGYDVRHPVHTLIPEQGRRTRTRLAVVHYHADMPEDQLRSLDGVPVVSPALTIFLLAGSQHPARTERALDNAWSKRLVTYDVLHELLGRLAIQGRNGIRVMRKLLAARPSDYVAPESGLEARTARLAADVGVDLIRQVDVGGQDWIGRVDFLIEGSNRVIEVLSQRYHGAPLDRLADDRRFARLNEAGFEVLTLWDTDIWNDADLVRDRIFDFSRAVLGRQAENGAGKRSSSPGSSTR